jgi:hypothetical protein
MVKIKPEYFSRCGDQDMGWTVQKASYDPPLRHEAFLLSKTIKPSPGYSQPPMEWILVVLSPGLNQPLRDTDHKLSSKTKAKSYWSCASTSRNALRICTGTLAFPFAAIFRTNKNIRIKQDVSSFSSVYA